MAGKRRSIREAAGKIVGGGSGIHELGVREMTQQREVGAETLLEMDPARISPAPWQPRRHFDEGALEELAESIRENGILQPLVARPHGDGYELLAGERRLKAARLVGLKTVPVRLSNASDFEARRITRAENRDRADLSPWEDAVELVGIRDAALAEGREMTIRELAEMEEVGQSTGSVSEKLRIADRLTPEVWRRAFDEPGHTRTPHGMAHLQAAISYRQLRLAMRGETVDDRARVLHRAMYDKDPDWAGAPKREPRKADSRVVHLRGGGMVVQIKRPWELSRVEARKILVELQPLLDILLERIARTTPTEAVLEHKGHGEEGADPLNWPDDDSAEGNKERDPLFPDDD